MQHRPAGQPVETTFKVEDAASYDSVVDDFDMLTGRYTAPVAQQLIELAGIASGQKVLDVGCGTGVLTFLAARKVGRSGRVVGFDLSDGMLAKATTLALAGPDGERTEFVKGDAERMQFADSEFDAVVSLYALRHFPNPEQALREMFRCSKPGSQTLVAVGSAPPPGSRAFFDAGMRLVAERMLGLVGRAPLYATTFLDRLIEQTLPGAGHDEHAGWTHGVKQYSGTVSALMQRVGYEKISSSWVGHAAVLESAQDFWTLQVTLSSFARKRMQAVTPAQYKDLRTKFDAICNRHLARGGRLIYKSGALITTGRRPAR